MSRPSASILKVASAFTRCSRFCRRFGVSIVLTTHHLEEAEQRCERIVIIDHGKTVAAGTLPELMTATVGSARTLAVTLDQAAGHGRCNHG